MKPASEFRHVSMSLGNIVGDQYVEAVGTAYGFLKETPVDKLRSMVGQILEFIPDFDQAGKEAFVESYQKPVQDDPRVEAYSSSLFEMYWFRPK